MGISKNPDDSPISGWNGNNDNMFFHIDDEMTIAIDGNYDPRGSGGGSSNSGSGNTNTGNNQEPDPVEPVTPTPIDAGDAGSIEKFYFPVLKCWFAYSLDGTKIRPMTTSSIYEPENEKSTNLEDYEWREIFELGQQSLIFNSCICIPYKGDYPRNGSTFTSDYACVVQIKSDKKIFVSREFSPNIIKSELMRGVGGIDSVKINIGYGDLKSTKTENITNISDYRKVENPDANITILFTDLSDENGHKLIDTDLFGDGIDNISNEFEIKCIIYNTTDVNTRKSNPYVIETSVKINKVEVEVKSKPIEKVNSKKIYKPYISYKPASKSDYFGDLTSLTTGGSFIETRLNTPFGIKSSTKTVYLQKDGESTTDLLSPKLYYVDDPDYLWFYFDTYNELESVYIQINGPNWIYGTYDNNEDHKVNPINLNNYNFNTIYNDLTFILSEEEGSGEEAESINLEVMIEFQKIKVNSIKNRYIFKSLKRQKYFLNNSTSISIILNLKNDENIDFNNKENTLLDIKNNSNSSIEFINTKLKLNIPIQVNEEFTKNINNYYYNSEIEDFAQKTYYKGILCAIFSITNDFSGKINAYYGAEKLYIGDSKDIVKSDIIRKIKTQNEEKIVNLFYLYEIKNGFYGNKFLYVYLYGYGDDNNSLIGNTLNKKISIYIEDSTSSSESDITSNIISSNNLEQKTLSYYEIDINRPEITSDNEIVYIDDSIYGKTHHYTYITEIDTENGKRYYGVRAKKRIRKSVSSGDEPSFDTEIFTSDLYKLGIDGLTYNVHAKVVPLQSRSENYNIYSFVNGEQLVTLNQSALNIYGSKDSDGYITWYNIGNGIEYSNEMLSTYIYSYSYIIEGKEPANPNNDYLIRFTSLKGNKSLKEISSGEIEENNTYVSLSYIQTKILEGEYVYTKINNFGSGELLTYNINREEEINTYEYSYSEIDNGYEDYENLYKLTYEYVKVSPSILTLDLFKTAITRYYSNEDSRDDTIYYKYISSTGKYSKYTLNDIKKLKELPLNIYSKSYYYLKLSSTQINDDNITKYKKDFIYNIVPGDVTNSEEEILYATDSYIPIRNKFIKDGTAEYYSYIYSEITNEDIELALINVQEGEEETFPYDSLYVKQNYELLKNPTPNLIERYNNNKIKLYTLESKIKSSIISNDETIYSLDLSGNTIYADTEGKIIPLEKIITKYSNLMKDPYTPSENEIFNDKENNSQFFITNLEGLGDNGEDIKIKSRVSLDGNYVQPSLNKIKNIISGNNNDNNNDESLYIDGESYVNLFDFSTKENNINNTKDWIKKLKRYNVKLYTKKFGKLRIDDFKYLSDEDDVFVYLGEDLKKIDKNTGLPIGVTIYERKSVYNQSFDLNMSRNKDYFSYTNQIISIGNQMITYQAFSGGIYNSIKKRINTGNENLIQDVTQIKYYVNDISYYSYNENLVNLVSQFDELTRGDSDAEPEIFFKTKYLYEKYSINDGINLDTNGSYYTTISLFDGKNGKSPKKMYLNTHLRTATRYSYDYTEEGDYQVSNVNSELLSSLNPSQYGEYYIEYHIEGEADPRKEILNERSESPAYFVTQSSYSLFTHYSEVKHSEYIGESNEVEDNGEKSSWQFFDTKNKLPITVLHNNELFGLIFGDNPYTDQTSNIITFKNGTKFLEENGSTFLNTYTYFEETNDDNKDKDKETVNNEIYYNDYTDDNVNVGYVKKYEIGYRPEDYEYEIVELKKFIFRKSSSFKTKYSERDYEVESISVEKPFIIGNAEKIEFDGTYNWVEPEYTNIINSDGSMVEIITKDGYWKKNYERKSIPFTIASYNYYDKNDVSSINITYNFVPNSYILTAQIDHPKITYNYLVSNTEELVRYSYIINGFEYDYPINGQVTYSNGSYYGVINEKYYVNDDFCGYITYSTVKLYRRKELITNTNVKNIINQDKFTSYEYFTYSQATPLTNEKIPVLYNTELIPAKTKRVQYWDVSKNSYSVKTVVSSYAYYSYKYIYETVPFKVASYVYTDEFTISNFETLGAYISNIGDVISYSVNEEKESTDRFNEKLDNNINKFIDIYSSYNTYGIEKIDSSISKLYENVYTLSDTSYSVLSTLRDNISYSINTLSNGSKEVVNEFKNSLIDKIGEQHSSIKDGFEKQTTTLENRLSDIHDVIHTDILGENPVKNENLTYSIYTYTPILSPNGKLISGYSISTSTGEINITRGGNNISEIITDIFSTIGTETVMEYHDDNSYTITTYPVNRGIGDILSHLTVTNSIPKYNEFMVDLVPKLFSSIDFDNDTNIEYDDEGNVISKGKQNPTDIAKKCIMRADILWNELKKKGIVS